jgi:hypothetical protein
MDEDALYRIHVDNTGDGIEDLTFQFRFENAVRDIAIPVGAETVAVPLINVGQVSGGPGNRDQTLNRLESYTVRVVRGPLDDPASVGFLRVAGSGSRRFGKPVDNIGNKSIPDYEAYARQFIAGFQMPGCSGEGRVFVGQRAEGFAVNLGEIFDLVNIANPLVPRREPNISAKNVTTIALEVPTACLTSDQSAVIGGWTTASLGGEQPRSACRWSTRW